ncbi:helix-turn-helix domain-containing protein [Mycobacterium kansasii]
MVRRGITQTKLAPRLNMTQQALSRRISGHTAFKVGELQQISDQLGVPITDLLNDSLSEAS